MNRLQANLCLLCVTLCWSAEVVLYACIPEGVPAFATSAVTALAGAALLFVPFHRRVAAELKAGGWRFIATVFGLAALSAAYNTLYLYGSKSFDVASGAFTFCMTVVILPVVLLTMRRRVEPGTWISVVLVLAGIVLALGPSVRVSQTPGLGLMGAGCLLRVVGVLQHGGVPHRPRHPALNPHAGGIRLRPRRAEPCQTISHTNLDLLRHVV